MTTTNEPITITEDEIEAMFMGMWRFKAEAEALRRERDEARADSARLDWLEQSVQGTGASRFLKSVFISYALGSETDLLLDVKGEDVIRAASLRAAIDSAMKPTP